VFDSVVDDAQYTDARGHQVVDHIERLVNMLKRDEAPEDDEDERIEEI
jgi:Txe/YoeB family toxin of Txe-Axe toxin-antitoxin module